MLLVVFLALPTTCYLRMFIATFVNAKFKTCVKTAILELFTKIHQIRMQWWK